jgi:hypothetical protein
LFFLNGHLKKEKEKPKRCKKRESNRKEGGRENKGGTKP